MRRRTPLPPCGRPSSWARRPSASATSSAPPSRGNAGRASTSTRGPRSAWPPPRHSPASSWCSACWPCTWGACAGCRCARACSSSMPWSGCPSRPRRSWGRRSRSPRSRRSTRTAATSSSSGRLYEYPTALEGALKLKEISYIHAEGVQAAEMKHGPIALIEPDVPTVVLAAQAEIRDKMLGNTHEILARKGKVIAVGQEGDEELAKLATETHLHPEDPRPARAHPRRHPPAAPCLLRGGRARMRRGQAAQPRQERHGGVGA